MTRTTKCVSRMQHKRLKTDSDEEPEQRGVRDDRTDLGNSRHLQNLGTRLQERCRFKLAVAARYDTSSTSPAPAGREMCWT